MLASRSLTRPLKLSHTSSSSPTQSIASVFFGRSQLLLSSLVGCRLFSASSISDPANKLQVYTSRCDDPCINLSIEHHLLTHSPPDSRVLFLYINRPSVIIGRNQNPWLEVNLPLLGRIRDEPPSVSAWHTGPIDLVRRRSGGGAVFHDAGNVNFSVICPPEDFDRDRHALMVVRALGRLGHKNTRVNERHDIVIDLPSSENGGSDSNVRKISGSAYKLTRLRALHHGTCLLQSPNLGQISPMLRSPAAPFITALGSPSVRSPVANVGVEPLAFMGAVVAEFKRLYGPFNTQLEVSSDEADSDSPGALPWHEISRGVKELRSKEWIYGQTPRFSFDSKKASNDVVTAPPPSSTKLCFDTRHGKIDQFELDGVQLAVEQEPQESQLPRNLWECRAWPEKLAQAGMSQSDAASLGSWLQHILGSDFSSGPNHQDEG